MVAGRGSQVETGGSMRLPTDALRHPIPTPKQYNFFSHSRGALIAVVASFCEVTGDETRGSMRPGGQEDHLCV